MKREMVTYMHSKILFSGESKNVEYKLTPPSHSINYTKTAVAFANCQGGSLVFGIEDQTLRVVGIPEDKVFTVMDAISNAIVDSCEPMIIPDITMRDVDGKTVIVAEIAPGLQRPYYIKSLGRDAGTFVRVAGTTRQADAGTIKELLLEGSNQSFDQVPCLGMSVTEDDIERLCDSLTQTARANAKDAASVKPVTKRQLVLWGVLVERNGEMVPTNAFAILAGNESVRSVIQCGVFKGETKAVFVDRREFAGTPVELIEQTYQYVLRNIHMGATFEGVYRQDVYEIPPAAIRELIINAVVHRSYVDHSSIQVAIYDNRLEVTSPGRLPMGQTIERMKQGYSKIRNEALASAFEYMGLIEHWGSGILRIMQEVRDTGLPEPEFLGGDTDLRVNIYRAMNEPEDAAKLHDNVELVPDQCRTSAGLVPEQCRTLTDQQRAIYEHVMAHGRITSSDVKQLFGVKERRARALIQELVSLDILKKLGHSQQTRYVLAELKNDKEPQHEG